MVVLRVRLLAHRSWPATKLDSSSRPTADFIQICMERWEAVKWGFVHCGSRTTAQSQAASYGYIPLRSGPLPADQSLGLSRLSPDPDGPGLDTLAS